MIDKQKAQELAQYFNKTTKQIIEEYKSIKTSPSKILWVKRSNDEWKKLKINQKSRKGVEKWFKTTKNYIFELMEVQSMPLRIKLNSQIITYCKSNNLKTILDFGCGVAENAIIAAENNFKVTIADLPSQTFNFAKWRIKKRKLNIKIIEIKSLKPLIKNYDAIVCLEVFQHLFNPLKTARHLFAHLNKGGLLFVTTRFNNPSYLMTLKKNYRLEQTFNKDLEKIGFNLKKKLYQWGKGNKAKYLYIFQKP